MAGQLNPSIWCPGIVPVGHPLRTGIACHIPMWEMTGNTAMDVSGNRNHGTLTNMPLATCW
ncbi:MAG TPA: hypothetical protein VMY35_06770, partial [Phycisphaerae bacterium]|nr:hypothetical protein [Phycisphaerae bacterium]